LPAACRKKALDGPLPRVPPRGGQGAESFDRLPAAQRDRQENATVDPRAEKRKKKAEAKEKRGRLLLLCLVGAGVLLTMVLALNSCR